MSEISMMNTDMLAGLFAQFPTESALPLGLSPQQPGVFQDLLGLVSDAQVADAQSFEQSDMLAQRVAQLIDPAQQAINAQTNAAMSALAMPIAGLPVLKDMPAPELASVPDDASMKAVGRSAAPVAGETLSTEQMLLGAEELQGLGQRKVALGQSQALENHFESAVSWANALQSGDVKAVQVLADAPMPAKPGVDHFNAAMAPQLPGKEGSDKALMASAVMPAEKALGKESASANRPKFESAQLDVVKNAAAKDAAPMRSEPQSGADFVLGQMAAPAQAHMASDKQPQQLAPAVSGAMLLGQPEDKRVSSDSLNFVADKIQKLQEQGGGRIKVQLTPHELGAIDIVVSNVRGEVRVQVTAERPETLSALQSAKGELSAKLDSLAPSSLELGAMPARAELQSARVAGDVKMASGSADFLKLQSHVAPEGAARALNEGASAMRTADAPNAASRESGFAVGKAPRSEEFLAGQQGWQREERRQQAMDQWEQQRQRKSA